jgi:hypothetical protein
MKLPQRATDVIRELYERNKPLAQGDDNQRRALTKIIAEQICFDLGPTWGTKRADSGRPPSKDAIAQKQPDGKLFSWDWQNGATREPIDDPDHVDITGQVFIEVAPVAHLDGQTGPPPTDDVDVEAIVRAAEARLSKQFSDELNVFADIVTLAVARQIGEAKAEILAEARRERELEIRLPRFLGGAVHGTIK